jgi:Rieske Fe-S protein
MNDKLPPPTPQEQEQRLERERLSRRTFLMKTGLALNGLVALVLAVPIVRYLLSAIGSPNSYLRWTEIGNVADFHEGETKLISFRNPFTNPWDGQTAEIPAYVRKTASGFTVFAINCAHLGCPVRWFSESQLFMCPCHGGIYYADGSRASGPPERGLFTYNSKVENDKLYIDAGQIPTLSNRAKLIREIHPCPGTNGSTIG